MQSYVVLPNNLSLVEEFFFRIFEDLKGLVDLPLPYVAALHCGQICAPFPVLNVWLLFWLLALEMRCRTLLLLFSLISPRAIGAKMYKLPDSKRNFGMFSGPSLCPGNDSQGGMFVGLSISRVPHKTESK